VSTNEAYVVGCLTTTAPGANSNTYPLFNSATWGIGAGVLPLWGNRLLFSLTNSQAGTLKAYRSIDKGTTWEQIGGDLAVAANSSTDISGPYDFLIDAHPDVKLDWVNGGVAQATWRPSVTIVRSYHGSAI
jgi:hypothetical protein